MLKKLRTYHHFIKRQQKHKQAFGVHPIRAVLIETTDEPRARRLMELARQPAVLGDGRRTSLFWFGISPLFTEQIAGGNKGTARYLDRPQVVFESLWATADILLHSIRDKENVTTVP